MPPDQISSLARGLARCLLALAVTGALIHPAAAGKATLNLVLVLDGLRPDSITPEETPNLRRLRREGVNFSNSHAVFPTVTRVNAAAIATGAYPGRNGMLGNSIYVPAVDPNRAFPNSEHRNLLRLDAATGGHMLLVKSLAELLAERGKRLAVVSSGSTGSALLLNPRAPKGGGVLINGYWEPGVRVGFPAAVSDEVLSRFGAAPKPGADSPAGAYDNAVAWTQVVLRDYVLPELKPDVIINWLTEPDHIQHARGVGSPPARASIRADDAEVGLLLERLSTLGLAATTNVIVVSDHGFSHGAYGVNPTTELVKAGLKASVDSDDVVIASNTQSMSLHVKDHDRAHIHRLIQFLQAQKWIGVLFTAGEHGPASVEGRESGTFALELIHMAGDDLAGDDLAGDERAPDIVVTFPWGSERNPFGVPGTDTIETAGTNGPVSGSQGNHGSMSPWTVRNTFIAWGVDFKAGVTVRSPVSNVDLVPTLLALMGLDRDPSLPRFDGRPLSEAFVDGPDPEQVPGRTITHLTATADGAYRAAIEVSEVGSQRYIDKSWRIR